MGFCSPVTRHLADFVYRRLPPLNSNHIRILASRNCSDKGCRQLRFSLSTQKGQMETDLCGGKHKSQSVPPLGFPTLPGCCRAPPRRMLLLKNPMWPLAGQRQQGWEQIISPSPMCSVGCSTSTQFCVQGVTRCKTLLVAVIIFFFFFSARSLVFFFHVSVLSETLCLSPNLPVSKAGLGRVLVFLELSHLSKYSLHSF